VTSPTSTNGVSAAHSPRKWPSPLQRFLGRSLEVQAVSLVLLVGLGALAIGLDQVGRSPDWGFTWDGALNGVLSQVPVTAIPAVLVALAAAANVLAGAIVLRLLGVPAFRSLSDLIAAGFAAAVVLDAAALFSLGSVGLFGWPELMALHLAAGAAYAARRRSLPLLGVRLRFKARRPAAWWLLVAAVWAGPLIVQLASPAAPFLDVLPNHVAPVEHVRVFGNFATLTTSPSPIYGPSRLMLGYVGLLGDLTTITNLEAVLAVAAFAFPLSVVMAVSLRQFTARLFGAGAGFWVLLTFPLTFTFMRLADTRGTVAAFPLAVYALGSIAQEFRARTPADPDAKLAGAGRPDLALAAALGGAILVHPLVGLAAAAAAVGMLGLDPRRLGPRLLPALGTAALIAVPQGLTMLGIAAPSWTGFLWLAAAVSASYGLAWLFERGRLFVPFTAADTVQVLLVGAAIVAFVIVARQHIPTPDDPASYMHDWFPRILLASFVGLALGVVRNSRGWMALGCAAAAGLGAWAASGLVGRETLTQQAIHYEVPKTIEYWLPVVLAVGAAGGISAVWRIRRLDLLRPLALGAFLLYAIVPYRLDAFALKPGPIVEGDKIGEHRAAESLGLALREAERGYWVGYPDSRLIVDADEQQVIDELRSEVTAGRLGASTRVLHVADSFQQWASVPVGVFVGALETSISSHPETSIHTDGGRLLGFDQLDSELASDYGYVVLEPNNLDPGLADTIVASGYHQIWANSIAMVFARN
jgi:hypothetical protein